MAKVMLVSCRPQSVFNFMISIVLKDRGNKQLMSIRVTEFIF